MWGCTAHNNVYATATPLLTLPYTLDPRPFMDHAPQPPHPGATATRIVRTFMCYSHPDSLPTYMCYSHPSQALQPP